jgi:hypothetical protein
MKSWPLRAKLWSVLLIGLVALSCMMSRANPPPVQDEVIKAALVKGFSEIYMTPSHVYLDSSRRVRIIGYEVGPSEPYDPAHISDHFKLSDVPRGATLYNVRAKFEISGDKRLLVPDGLQRKLARFLCYKDNYGEFVCKLTSDEDI